MIILLRRISFHGCFFVSKLFSWDLISGGIVTIKALLPAPKTYLPECLVVFFPFLLLSSFLHITCKQYLPLPFYSFRSISANSQMNFISDFFMSLTAVWEYQVFNIRINSNSISFIMNDRYRVLLGHRSKYTEI